MAERIIVDHSEEGKREAALVLKEAMETLADHAYREDHEAAELFRGLKDASSYTHIVEK